MSTLATFEGLVATLREAALAVYGEKLVSLVVYGSVGRGAPRPDSDIDVLLVVRDLPGSRSERLAGFGSVEARLEPALTEARREGVETYLSPVLKTPEEALRGSPLFLDMTEDARLIVDREGFFATVLDRLRGRMQELGSRRVWRGLRWYWDLKPDFKWGDEIVLFDP